MRRAAIIIGIILVAIAVTAGVVYFITHRAAPDTTQESSIAPITAADHILGNPAAPILLVEYCDIESPYCRSFQSTLESILGVYGKAGSVAWIYRHITLTDQYPDSEHFAEASECASASAGTSGFFKFIDAIDALTAPPTDTDIASIVSTLGIDPDAFSTCMTNGTYADLVKSQSANAVTAGATGAPYTVVLINGKPSIPIQGVFSYDQMKQLIDTILSKIS